jgi:hypothetical protein
MARYVPFGAGNSSSGATFGVLGHEMINDTKRRQLQDARDSGPLLARQWWRCCRQALEFQERLETQSFLQRVDVLALQILDALRLDGLGVGQR